MSGHSKWHNIQKTKGAQDAKRAAAFTKIAKELIVAVKEGGGITDPANNSRLATVITKAKAANMPNDNIKRCLEKAAGNGGGDNYETITYEGYGPGGVNDVLAQTLELKDITVLDPKGTDEEGNPWGLLRMGSFEGSLPAFLSHVKEKLGTPTLRYTDGGRPVGKVAVGGGACAGALVEAYYAGCDTFVTADVKYNQFWDAQDLGMNLIDAGHFYTENPVVAVLAQKIAEAFPEIQVIISKTHTDCMKFY